MASWLGHLSVARKLSLLGLLALLMVGLPLGLLLQRIGEGIDDARAQQRAAAPLLELQRSTQLLQQHRGLTAQSLAGASEAAGKLAALRPRLQAQIGTTTAALGEHDAELARQWETLAQRIGALTASLDHQTLDAADSFAEHTALVGETMRLSHALADHTGLSMSAEPALHHLVRATVFTQPALGEALAQARGLGAQVLARGEIGAGERARIAGLAARLDDGDAVMQSFTSSFTTEPALAERLGQAARITADSLSSSRMLIQRELLDTETPTLATATYWAELSAALDAQLALSTAALDALRELLDGHAEALATARTRTLAGLAALALLATLLAVVISRSISRPLARAVSFAEAIGAGRLDTAIALDGARDETGRLLQGLAGMRDSLRERIEAERTAAMQNLRLGKALDAAQSGVMVADTSNTIVYMNKRVRDLFTRCEADLRRDYPQFSVERLVGSPFDLFHRSPDRSRAIVERLADGQTHRLDITVAGHHFRQHLCLLHDDSGERMGAMVDWTDRTTEVEIENEISRIVRAAADGQLDSRIDIAGKDGFIRQLGSHINALLDATAHGIDEVHGILEALSTGDLSRRSTADLRGIFLRMRDDANRAADKLEEVIGTIKEAVDAIHTAASEIATGNADLSSRTEQQAANLEETASSMEELTSTVRQNADAAREARALAASASAVATRGGGEVNRVVDTMQAISAASRRIEDIIGVIDGIAFQTNILALNAAVEAARAGDQGRGFAVVASEVRTLAQRSAEAAKEIKTLIAKSVSTVAEGARLVEHAGGTMREIVTSVSTVNDLIGDIAAATEEQSAGIDTVNGTVIQLDQMTQQNAALVEEASAAAHAMEDQAAELAAAVSVFRLREA